MTRQSLDVVTPDGTHIPTGDPKGCSDGGGFRPRARDATITLARPLWSLASKWGGGRAFSYRNCDRRAVVLRHRHARVRRSRHAATPRPCAREFRYKTVVGQRERDPPVGHHAEAAARRSATRSSSQRADAAAELPGAIRRCARDFIDDVFPRNEVISQPYVEYSLFHAAVQDGAQRRRRSSSPRTSGSVRISTSSVCAGARAARLRPQLHAARRIGGRLDVPAGAATASCASRRGAPLRIQEAARHDRQHGDRRGSARRRRRSATCASSAQALVETRWHDTQNALLHDRLRQRPARRITINAVLRRSAASSAQLEARTLPMPTVWVLPRSAASCSTRPAAPRTRSASMQLYHDVGLGVRTLIPQTSRELFRFDLAFPLVREPGQPRHPALHRRVSTRTSAQEPHDEVRRRSTVRPADRPHHSPGAPMRGAERRARAMSGSPIA